MPEHLVARVRCTQCIETSDQRSTVEIICTAELPVQDPERSSEAPFGLVHPGSLGLLMDREEAECSMRGGYVL